MEIPSNIQKEIEVYCEANKISDIDKFILKILRTGFNIEKYGVQPIRKESELKYVPLEKPTPVEKPKKVTKKVVKEQPIEEKKKDLYDED